MNTAKNRALLALADGSLFWGIAIGAEGSSVGEVVFNTSMTGYQEIITDPSYAKQIVTLTSPHIGNVGINVEDNESDYPHLAGLIIRDFSLVASNWRSEQRLDEYLREHHIVGIADIDTRQLTRLLRDRGAQHGCIVAGEAISEQKALDLARSFSGLAGLDLAKEVTTTATYEWCSGSWSWPDGYQTKNKADCPFHVVVYDYGVKRSILRLLVDQGCHLTVVPATTTAQAVLALKPDGIFFSNGPGDPAACDYAINAIKTLLPSQVPLFGICLGFQLLALACGGKTEKMKFGHHGANHPVRHHADNRVAITSQNHGFAVAECDLPAELEITASSMFDGTPQGLKHRKYPAFGYQGHPEASPGPHDLRGCFAEFVEMIRHAKKN